MTGFGAKVGTNLSEAAEYAGFSMAIFVRILVDVRSFACENHALPAPSKAFEIVVPSESVPIGKAMQGEGVPLKRTVSNLELLLTGSTFLTFTFLALPTRHNIRDGRVLKNLRCRIPHCEKYLIQRPMIRILRD